MKVKDLKALLNLFNEDDIVVIEYDKELLEITHGNKVDKKSYTADKLPIRGKFQKKTGPVLILTSDLI